MPRKILEKPNITTYIFSPERNSSFIFFLKQTLPINTVVAVADGLHIPQQASHSPFCDFSIT